jgi:hypothetical protein
MNRRRLKRHLLSGLVLFAGLWLSHEGAGFGLAQDRAQTISEKQSIAWHSAAKLHHLAGAEKGDLAIGVDGIEFRPGNGRAMKLPFLEVQSFLVSPRKLTIETYQNRKAHLPGVERYRFDLAETIPPSVAAELAGEVQRPSQNAVPDPAAQGTVIAAHHRTVRGGTNGTLRFSDEGIDYVTNDAGDSRSWRWDDLQTLSAPDPYHLFVFGYRDTYTFDLKQILPHPLYDRLVNALDRHSVSGLERDAKAPESSETHGQGANNE